MIPESQEVIDEAAKKIRRLVVRLTNNGGDEKSKEALQVQLGLVTEDYTRASRVADVFAHRIIDVLNVKFKQKNGHDLDGIEIEFDHEPEPYEVAYTTYLNQLIAGQVGDARDTFGKFVASESDEDLEHFLLTLAKYSVDLG